MTNHLDINTSLKSFTETVFLNMEDGFLYVFALVLEEAFG